MQGSRAVRRLLPGLILIVALLPRLAPLDRYVTPDEPAWVYRSIRFRQALSSGDLSAVPATGHPGVTTMWLGGLGVQLHRWLDPGSATRHLEWVDGLAGLSPENPAAFAHLAFFLPAGRLLVALSTSLGLVAVFLLARRLWGTRVAALGALLLALDPFLAGHSGLLHLDGLLATTATLSALAALLAVRPEQARRYRWAALSGLLGGLAALTKTPGGLLAPLFALLLVAAGLARRISWRQALLALGLWALAAGLTFLALYPALWAAPVDTLRGLFDVGGRHIEGALRPIFFHGEMTYTPGAAFYPVVWLFRVSPLALAGLPLALALHLRRPGGRRFDALALTAFALAFGLLVSLAVKKHDRYLLPAFPPLTLVAALGWDGDWGSVLGVVQRFRNPRSLPGWVPRLGLGVLVSVQLCLCLFYLATPLGYFNPLLGGPRVAQNWLPVGWGEGLGAAARWLNRQPNAGQWIVATPSIPPFASLFAGRTVPLGQEALAQADYVVYPPEQGADRTPLAATAPLVYEKRVGGVRHARVLRNPGPEAQAAYLRARTRPGETILLDAEAALARLYDGPADLLLLADARDPAQIAARLADLQSHLWYVALPAASPLTAQQTRQFLTCAGQPISSTTVAGVLITQFPPLPQPCDASPLASRLSPLAPRFNTTLALLDAYLPPTPIAWPDPLPLTLRWEALAIPEADYGVILHLKDGDGHIWVEGGQELLDADYRRPTAWDPGHWSDQRFKLTLPAAIPPGQYSVEVGVFDPRSGRAASARYADGTFAGLWVPLGPVDVAPPPRPPTPWDMVMAERLDPALIFGPLALLGFEPPPARIASGDRVSFDLFWQALSPPGVDYALRWRLTSPGGNVVREESVPLSPYATARWRDGELEQVRYDVAAPPELPAGDYSLAINVLAPGGTPLWGGDYVLAGVEILARDRLFSLPQDIAYPLDLQLGTLVHLRGFDVGAQSARPGDQIPLTLYWQADGPTDLSYTVFVHLVGPDGMLHGQVDRPPAAGAAPTHSWAPGQVIIDEISLPVLPDASPGTYHVAVGLYDQVSGGRLPVYDSAGAALPDGQVVLPIEVTLE